MVAALVRRVQRLGRHLVQAVSRRLTAATRPSSTRLVVDTLADLPRSKGELSAENALRRSVKRVHCTPTNRALLVLLASRVCAWRHAVLIVRGVRRGAAAGHAGPGAGQPARAAERKEGPGAVVRGGHLRFNPRQPAWKEEVVRLCSRGFAREGLPSLESASEMAEYAATRTFQGWVHVLRNVLKIVCGHVLATA
jgi:hypothetical protein